jgi:hypothetical protein
MNMSYITFRDAIRRELRRHQRGLTWKQLRDRLDLPYERPCPNWVARLEQDINLSRARAAGREYVWKAGR